MKTAIFKIDGMHCNGCANTIKALLERQQDVKLVAVSFDEHQARVLYDPKLIDEPRLQYAIGGLFLVTGEYLFRYFMLNFGLSFGP